MNTRIVRLAIPGAKVSLKPDAHSHMKSRQWIFQCIEKDNIARLMHEDGLYGIGLDAELINWQDYPEPQHNSSSGKRGDGQTRL